MHRMLIVDDERFEREGIKFLLNKHRIPVQIAEADDGAEALDYVARHPVHILMTDIRMQQVDGLQLVEQVRKMNPAMKIIISSAYGEFEYARKAIDYQVLRYLVKPFDIDDFIQLMTQLTRQCEEERRQDRQAEWEQEREQERESPACEPAPAAQADDPVESNRLVIRRVLEIVENEYHRDLHLDAIAARVYLSPSYLSHLFKKETGESLVRHMTKLRLDKASYSLRHTTKRIADIGEEVGLPNLSYFCALFKHHYGCTPAKYREQAK